MATTKLEEGVSITEHAEPVWPYPRWRLDVDRGDGGLTTGYGDSLAEAVERCCSWLLPDVASGVRLIVLKHLDPAAWLEATHSNKVTTDSTIEAWVDFFGGKTT